MQLQRKRRSPQSVHDVASVRGAPSIYCVKLLRTSFFSVPSANMKKNRVRTVKSQSRVKHSSLIFDSALTFNLQFTLPFFPVFFLYPLKLELFLRLIQGLLFFNHNDKLHTEFHHMHNNNNKTSDFESLIRIGKLIHHSSPADSVAWLVKVFKYKQRRKN